VNPAASAKTFACRGELQYEVSGLFLLNRSIILNGLLPHNVRKII